VGLDDDAVGEGGMLLPLPVGEGVAKDEPPPAELDELDPVGLEVSGVEEDGEEEEEPEPTWEQNF
jgi:hypothetical protein